MRGHFLTTLLAFAGISAAQAASNLGLAYGVDANMETNKHVTAGVDLWVAGTASGIFLDHFVYGEVGGQYLTFTAARGISFSCYQWPFFGLTAEIWMDGTFGPTTTGGPPVVARYRYSDPAGSSLQFSYFTMDIYDWRDLTHPIYSRFGIANDKTHILCSGDPGPISGGNGVSSMGLAYANLFVGISNRNAKGYANYRVYSNGIIDFTYSSEAFVFMATRLRSFQCTNTGLVGKQADFWMDGYSGVAAACARTPAVAHVVVTQSSGDPGIDLVFIAVFDPHNLTTPVYTRLLFGNGGQNHILCK